MTKFFLDALYGFRMLRKDKVFTVAAVIVLAVGVCAVTTLFAIYYGVGVRGLPFPEGEQIVTAGLRPKSETQWGGNFTPEDFANFRKTQQSWEDISGWGAGTVNVTLEDTAIRFNGGFLMSNALDILRVKPMLGRWWTPEEGKRGSDRRLVLGYDVWQREFGGRPDVIGRQVRVNSALGQIIGVMPKGFAFPINEEVWTQFWEDPLPNTRFGGGDMWHSTFGRLKPGISRETAQAELAVFADNLGEEVPRPFAEWTAAPVRGYTDGFNSGPQQVILLAMLVAAISILLIACLNVANLILARATARVKELAVRRSLGASYGQIIRQVLTETLLLSLIGGVFGVLLSVLFIQLVDSRLAAQRMPFWFSFQLDINTLLVVLASVGLSALLAGFWPALQAAQVNLNLVLRDGGRGSTGLHMGWLTRLLVIGQVTVAALLVVTAGLFSQWVNTMTKVDVPYDPNQVMISRVGMFKSDFEGDDGRRRYLDRVQELLGAVPAVEEVGLTSRLRFNGTDNGPVMVEGETYPTNEDMPFVHNMVVNQGYLNIIQAKVLKGRGFEPTDTLEAPRVILIDEELAAKLFPDKDPINQRIRFPSGDQGQPENPWLTVVGVVAKANFHGTAGQRNGPDRTLPGGFYIPLDQYEPLRTSQREFFTIVSKVRGSTDQMAAEYRRVAHEANPNVPLYWTETYQMAIDEMTSVLRFVREIFIVLGVFALVLAAAGIYGVMQFSVSQRTREFGIRLALGSPTEGILSMVFRQSAWQALVGVVVGMVLAFVAALFLQRAQLPDLVPFDPPSYAIAVTVLALTSALATLWPALRATRVPPAVALQGE